MALGHRNPFCFSSSSCTDPENRDFHPLSERSLLPASHRFAWPALGRTHESAWHHPHIPTERGYNASCGFILTCLCQSLPAPLPVSSPGGPRLCPSEVPHVPLLDQRPGKGKVENPLWPQVQAVFSPNNNNTKCILLWYFLLLDCFKIHCRVGDWINSLKPQSLTAWKLDSGLNFSLKGNDLSPAMNY